MDIIKTELTDNVINAVDECGLTTVFQTMEVCVPITITPTADVGDIIVTCCGPADISNDACPTGGEPSYTFYVSRIICCEIPIEFTATGTSATASVVFEEPNQEGCECPTNGGGE